MERKITAEMISWKEDPDRKPLIITGGRQTGKTYSVKEFAEAHYRSHVYINFEINPEKKTLFAGSLDPADLIPRIIMSEKTELYDGGSLIILDEIQSCTAAYSALKPLSEDHRFDVIAMGSFLGINLDDDDDRISPLGYVDMLRMHPMDFEEYLWAMGIRKELIELIKECIRDRKAVPDYFHRQMSDHFRRYIAVGGMPAAVRTFAETSDYVRTSKKLDSIIALLMKDAGRYSRKAGRSKINACFRSIPHQLSREDKRFHYADVEKSKNKGKRVYGNALEWLYNSGLTLSCLNLSEPVMPLSERASENSFKVYMADTGILLRLMDGIDASSIVLNDPYANHGALMENAVASALSKKNYALYFYAKRDSTLEIDFVTNCDDGVALIEVKSGRDKRSKSLNTLMQEKNRNRTGIKIMDSNVEYDDKNGIWHLPLYAACFFEERTVSDIPPMPSSDEINRAFDEYMKNRGTRKGPLPASP